MAKKSHGHNFIIFSQASGQTLQHTGAYHLSTLKALDWQEFRQIQLRVTLMIGKKFGGG